MDLTTIPARLLVLALLGAATAGSWFAWFGWDHEYQVDPATGVASGPYEAWQVVGCVVTLLVAGTLAVLARVRPLAGTVVTTLALTAAWCSTEMPRDETGLAGVGAVMVLVGTGLASGLWFGVASALRPARARA